MDQLYYVGIDVSAKTLDVALARSGQSAQLATFANPPAGHRQLIKRLTKRGRSAQVCLEATGTYSLGVALALHHHARTEGMVVNPKAIKNYAGATMQRAKTDAVDAQLLLDYSQRMPFVCWQPPSDELLQLQAITRRIPQLKVEHTREANRLHADSYRAHTTDRITRDIQVNLRHLERRMQRLEKDGRALVDSVPSLREKFNRLLSITGIAQTSALRLVAELGVLPDDMKPPQWVAHAGLDPRARESGSSVHPPRRITKMGNKYIRAALYMPALVAIVHQPHIKAFYDKLVAAGKKPLQAIIAVMRKLLHTIWSLWKYNQDFDGQKFYKMTA
jgi:transposase